MGKTPDQREEELGRELWNYFQLNHNIRKVNIIVGMGNIDMLPAERAADLYLDGWSSFPFLIFTGGAGGRFSDKTPDKFRGKSEAEQMAITAMEMGVPENEILIENESKHTKANVELTLEMLNKSGIIHEKIMSVHMPSAERRDYGTWKNIVPETEIVIASPRVSYEHYHQRGFQGTFDRYKIISTLVGNIHRTIIVYPKKGDMIKQLITGEAREAYHELIDRGYNDELEKSALDDFIIPDYLIGDDRSKLQK